MLPRRVSLLSGYSHCWGIAAFGISLILGFRCFQEKITNVSTTLSSKGLKILRTRLTSKQVPAKKVRRSLSTTFSINRRNGRMCELGAVLSEKRKQHKLTTKNQCLNMLISTITIAFAFGVLELLLGYASARHAKGRKKKKYAYFVPSYPRGPRSRTPKPAQAFQKRLLCRLQIS